MLVGCRVIRLWDERVHFKREYIYKRSCRVISLKIEWYPMYGLGIDAAAILHYFMRRYVFAYVCVL